MTFLEEHERELLTIHMSLPLSWDDFSFQIPSLTCSLFITWQSSVIFRARALCPFSHASHLGFTCSHPGVRVLLFEKNHWVSEKNKSNVFWHQNCVFTKTFFPYLLLPLTIKTLVNWVITIISVFRFIIRISSSNSGSFTC